MTASHELTDGGVFIPAPTERERQLIYTPPEQWASEAAHKVTREASCAAWYASHPIEHRGHPWEQRRAELVAQGHEQWLLWMERPKEGGL